MSPSVKSSTRNLISFVVRAWPSRFFSMSDGTCMIRPKISKRRAETLRFYLEPDRVPGSFHFDGVEDPIRVFSGIATPFPVRELTSRVAHQVQFAAPLQLLPDFCVATAINDRIHIHV